MSKGGGGPRGPTPQEEKASAKAYWDNYSQWQSDATKSKGKKLGDIRARYAGQGALGKILMDAEISKYNEEMGGLQKGEHGTALQKYYDKMRQGNPTQESTNDAGTTYYTKPLSNEQQIAADSTDMNSFYQNLFGGGIGGADPEKELESDKRARISGAGGMWQ